MTIMRFNNQNFRRPRPVLDSTETVWTIGTTNTSMEEEEEPPMLTRRTDTITSSTQYFNLMDVQPRNNHRYSGVTMEPMVDQVPGDIDQYVEDVQESRAGVKRQHDDSISSSYIKQSKVIIVTADESFGDGIPLGGTADTLARTETVGLEVEQDTAVSISFPSATCINPSLENYPGQYSFESAFTKLSESSKNRHWDYSSMLCKLFIDMNKWIQVEFHVGPSPPAGLTVRALPVFSDANFIHQPVTRCPNHATITDPTNENFSYPEHLIRVAGDDVTYHKDESSGRLSVTFPVLDPPAGSERISKQVKFMCLGSDIGGINRRPTKVVFTLETNDGRVVGRNAFDVRICSCPKRDRQQEEERHMKHAEQAKSIAKKFANQTVVMKQEVDVVKPPPGKKPLKLIDKTKYLMIPVRIEDFKMLDDFAEKLAVGREIQNQPNIPHPQIIQAIKTERVKLQKEHNKEIISIIDQKKK